MDKHIYINETVDDMLFSEIYEQYIPKDIVYNKDRLFESYNLYDGIYEDIDEITKIIVNMIAGGIFDSKYTVPYNGKSLKIREIVITLYTNNPNYGGSCEIDGDIMYIEIDTGMMLRHFEKDTIYDIISRWLESTMVHELTHAKNDSELVDKYGSDKTPEWYGVATDALVGEDKVSGTPHIFFYSLYLSHYSEIHAMSAEVSSEIQNKIKYDKAWPSMSTKEKIEKIKEYIANNEYYRTYASIKQWKLPLLKKINRIEFDIISNAFKKHGISITKQDLNKYVKQIEYGCERAMTKIKRSMNGLFVYYNLV